MTKLICCMPELLIKRVHQLSLFSSTTFLLSSPASSPSFSPSAASASGFSSPSPSSSSAFYAYSTIFLYSSSYCIAYILRIIKIIPAHTMIADYILCDVLLYRCMFMRIVLCSKLMIEPYSRNSITILFSADIFKFGL